MNVRPFSSSTAFSIDPVGLYGQGGFFEGSSAGLRQACTVDVVRERPGYEYARPEPRVSASREFCAKLLAHYREIDAIFRRGSGTVTATLEDVVLYSNCLFVMDHGALTPLYDTYQPYDRHVIKLPDPTVLLEPTRLDDGPTYVHLGSSGSANYGHWIVDDLPRLHWPRPGDQLTVYLAPRYGEAVGEKKREFLERLLADAAAPWELRFVNPFEALCLPRVRFTSLPTYHPIMKDPRAMAWLRTKVGPTMAGATVEAGGSQRLFVSRASGHGRALTNEAEIAAQLSGRGFTYINTQLMSAAEQVSTFSSASVIVGAMGAAMTNTVFSPPDAHVIHLAPEGWFEPFYWDLAATTGQDYAAVYGAATAGVEPSWADYQIEFSALDNQLKRLGV